MARTQLNVRIPDSTTQQIAILIKNAGYESQSHVVIAAVERIYQQEISMKNTTKYPVGGKIIVPHPDKNEIIQAEIIGHWNDRSSGEAGVTVVDADRNLRPWEISYSYL